MIPSKCDKCGNSSFKWTHDKDKYTLIATCNYCNAKVCEIKSKKVRRVAYGLKKR